jgi:intracellular septation protein
MASTFSFSPPVSAGEEYFPVILGMALGLVQIGPAVHCKKPIDSMPWMSLFLVLGSGIPAWSPRFVEVKPSLNYIIVGVVTPKLEWMNRYLPTDARDRGGYQEAQ